MYLLIIMYRDYDIGASAIFLALCHMGCAFMYQLCEVFLFPHKEHCINLHIARFYVLNHTGL